MSRSALDRIFQAWLGVSPAAGRTLAALYEAGGAIVPYDRLTASCRQTRNGLNVSLKALRATMDQGAVANVQGRGYRLTPVGFDECRRALADAAEEAA